jgi:hypothetical protein
MSIKKTLLFLVIVFLQFACKKDHSDLPAAEEYCVWKIDDHDYKLTSPTMKRNYAAYDSLTQLFFNEPTPLLAVRIVVNGDRKPGVFPVKPFDLYSYGINKSYTNKDECNVTVSKWGAINDFLIGSFKGIIYDLDSIKHQISGNFKIKVTN